MTHYNISNQTRIDMFYGSHLAPEKGA